MLLSTMTLLAAAAAPAASCPAPVGDVIVVDATGGGDHLQVQAAVNAASPGDIVLVRGGTYAGFEVIGLGLTVIGDDVQPRPVIRGGVSLRSVPGGEIVVLSGFDIEGDAAAGVPVASGTAVEVVDCAGGVRLQDALLIGRDGAAWNDTPGRGGLISDSSDVALTDVQMRGGTGFSPVQAGFGSYADGGAPGLTIESSRVVVQRCVVTGGDGGSWTNDGSGGDGGAGLFASFRAELVLVHGLITGGAGGDSGDGAIPTCGRGGDALIVNAFETDARGRAITFVPGPGGSHVFFGNSCASGAEIEGPFTYWSGDARALVTAPLVRANAVVTTVALGQPDDLVWRWFSGATDWHRRPAWGGAILVRRSSPAHAQLLGRVPGTGFFQIADSWRLPAGMEGLTFHAQSAFTAPGRDVTLGNAVAITVVDPAF